MPQIVLPNTAKNRSLVALLAVGGVVVLVLLAVPLMRAVSWQAYSSISSRADKLDAMKDYAGEVKVLEDYVAGKPPSDYRYKALVRLGALDYKLHNYSKAFLAYEQARGLAGKPSAELLLGIALSAQNSGNKATAVAAYKDLIRVTPSKEREKIGRYQDQILYLGGTY